MITRALSNRRLLRLAVYLENLKRGRFNYGSWVGDTWGGSKDLSCGTTACALGWACAMPEFRRLGLALDACGDPVDRKNDAHHAEAACRIFGIDAYEANVLFMGASYDDYRDRSGHKTLLSYLNWDATAKQVAKRIRKFVEVRIAA